MLFSKPSPPQLPALDADDHRWRLADLEAAQRRDAYAAGRGDGRDRGARRWTALRRGKRR